ncbi:MAG: DUF1643 domain-containing protein [Ruminiclostridium sp.]|nr:DUF1643 domain-containing protein [Ruminiclostridium sp.]
MSYSERTTMTTEVIYNDTRTHRFLLRKHWNSDKSSAAVIMIYPSTSTGVTVDHTTMFTLQNLERLNFGGVYIVNLFSSLNGKHSKTDVDDENMVFIREVCNKADIVIWAVGTGSDGIKKVLYQEKQVLEILADFTDKLKCIADNTGKKFYHPLCPAVRYWNLVDFELKELKAFNITYDELKEQPKVCKGKKASIPVPIITKEDTADDVDGKSWYDADDAGAEATDDDTGETADDEAFPDEYAGTNIAEAIIVDTASHKKSRKKRK